MSIRGGGLAGALALVLAACGGGGDNVITEGTTSTSIEATPTSGGDAGTNEAGAPPTTGQATATTAGGGGGATVTTSAAPTAPGAAQPATAGTYTYDTDGETTTTGGLGGTEKLPPRTTLEVDPAGGNRQTSVRDMRDSDGDGSSTTTTLQYRDDGVYLEHLKIQARAGGLTFTYEFRPSPPQLLSPTGAGVGSHSEFTLTSTNGGLTANTVIDIVKEETLTIGGASVKTFLVKTTVDVSGDIKGTTTSNNNFLSARSLTVREDSVSDLETAFGKTHTEQVSLLRSLDPG